jgi:tRNA U34 5-methylaminomethyl-2-thiouridine-forming methyltransferase MnmC
MLQLIATGDGSSSLYNTELDEHYHSVHGAVQESKHVFIDAGLDYFPADRDLHILEIGLGTGLNTLLTLIQRLHSPVRLHYTAIEAYPLTEEILGQLNYCRLLGESELQPLFRRIHSSEWNDVIALHPQFFFKKINASLFSLAWDPEFDLIYFDAFGPRVQPEMWTEEVFTKMYRALKPGGILVTYCAKGEVKRTLKRCGFTVETLPGPPGKREMIRAVRE